MKYVQGFSSVSIADFEQLNVSWDHLRFSGIDLTYEYSDSKKIPTYSRSQYAQFQ